MTDTLRTALAELSNDYISVTSAIENMTGIPWDQPVAAGTVASLRVSVVVPARNVGYCLTGVLDALAAQTHRDDVEVIVIDDASTDRTAHIIAEHPVVTQARRLPQHLGTATARNLGTLLANGDTIVYVDADMLLPPNTVTELATRARRHLVLTGFRHNVPYGVDLPDAADLNADHRVRWRPPINVPLPYSGTTLTEPVDGRPLDHTRGFRTLGHGRRYYDWDLPRMVVTALLAVPRAAVLDVGGFDGHFGRLGWGMEDTYLGACLIAAGLLVVPVRPAVGFHLDPPDAAEQWQTKLAQWPATLARYRTQLLRPPPRGRSRHFLTATKSLLSCCEVLK